MTQQIKVRLHFDWEVTLPIKDTTEWRTLFNETALDMDAGHDSERGQVGLFSNLLQNLSEGGIDNDEFNKVMEINMAYFVRLNAEHGTWTDFIELLDDDAELEYVEL